MDLFFDYIKQKAIILTATFSQHFNRTGRYFTSHLFLIINCIRVGWVEHASILILSSLLLLLCKDANQKCLKRKKTHLLLFIYISGYRKNVYRNIQNLFKKKKRLSIKKMPTYTKKNPPPSKKKVITFSKNSQL